MIRMICDDWWCGGWRRLTVVPPSHVLRLLANGGVHVARQVWEECPCNQGPEKLSESGITAVGQSFMPREMVKSSFTHAHHIESTVNRY